MLGEAITTPSCAPLDFEPLVPILAKSPPRAIGPSFAAYSPTESRARSAGFEAGVLKAYVPTKQVKRIERSMVNRKRTVYCFFDSFGGSKGNGFERVGRVGRGSLFRGSRSAASYSAGIFLTGELGCSGDLDIARGDDEGDDLADGRDGRARTGLAWAHGGVGLLNPKCLSCQRSI